MRFGLGTNIVLGTSDDEYQICRSIIMNAIDSGQFGCECYLEDNRPPDECPCWTAEELDAFPYPTANGYGWCVAAVGALELVIGEIEPVETFNHLSVFENPPIYSCRYYVEDPDTNSRDLSVDIDEYALCKEQILQAAENRNMTCPNRW
jgi:hypothetical protein